MLDNIKGFVLVDGVKKELEITIETDDFAEATLDGEKVTGFRTLEDLFSKFNSQIYYGEEKLNDGKFNFIPSRYNKLNLNFKNTVAVKKEEKGITESVKLDGEITETVVAEKEDTGEYVKSYSMEKEVTDANGVVFDSSIHAVTKEGKPRLVAGKYFMKKKKEE